MSETSEQPQPTAQSPSSADDAAPQAPAKSLEELLAEAEAKLEEQRDAWLRALAEAENARKRAQADIANAHKYAVERIVESLVPVLDSLEAALADESPEPGVLRSGVELTLKQLRAALEKASVAEINPAQKDKFDPHRHQAMTMVETDAEPNSIVAVMQKGYSLHERVIRPALVTVAKAPSDSGGGAT